MKLIIVTLAIMAMTAQAFAEADFDPDKFKPPTTTTPPANTTTTTTTTTTPALGTVANPAQSTINQGSNTGQASQSSGSGANAAAGAALMAAGAALMANPPTAPQGAMLMAMGILAMMQSGHDGDAAGQSGNTGLASIEGNKGTSLTNTDPATGTSAFTDAKIAQGKAALEAQGYKMGPDGTLTRPDGTTVPASAYNSPSSMAAAGMSPQTIADAQKIVTDAEKDSPKVSGVGVNSAGGGGSGMAVSEGEGGGEANATGGMAVNPFNLNADAKAKLIAGKTVMFDGEPIGVRGQNIFDMVHDCYQKKRKGNHFIETENDVSIRSPASFRRKRN
jgi:hypothetical protein